MARRLLALLEVSLVFAAVHVAFRAFRSFTSLGQREVAAGIVLSPGLVMSAASLVMIFVLRRQLAAYGLELRRVGESAGAGLLAVGVLAVFGAATVSFGLPVRPDAIDVTHGLLFSCGGLVVTGVVLAACNRPALLAGAARASFVVLPVALTLPLVVALVLGRPAVPVATLIAWLVLGPAIGEELFFRGYVQSRLNEAFGRPWQFMRVRFGIGLVYAALLFALVHALNPFDYFGGGGELAWGHALATLGMPYGFLREKTQGIVGPVVLHGLVDVVARTPGLLD